MRFLDRAWQSAQKRFAIAFTIGATLSFANVLSNIQFVIDAFVFLGREIEGLPPLLAVWRIVELCVTITLDWWRGLLQTFFGWFNFSLPNWILDVASATSFIAGRVVTRWGAAQVALRNKLLAHRTSESLRAKVTSWPRTADAHQREEWRAVRNTFAFNKERAGDIRDLALDLLRTGALLTAFFIALYLIDYWYRLYSG